MKRDTILRVVRENPGATVARILNILEELGTPAARSYVMRVIRNEKLAKCQPVKPLQVTDLLARHPTDMLMRFHQFVKDAGGFSNATIIIDAYRSIREEVC